MKLRSVLEGITMLAGFLLSAFVSTLLVRAVPLWTNAASLPFSAVFWPMAVFAVVFWLTLIVGEYMIRRKGAA